MIDISAISHPIRRFLDSRSTRYSDPFEPRVRELLSGFRPVRIESYADYVKVREADEALRGQIDSFGHMGVGGSEPIKTSGYCVACQAWRNFTTPARPGGAASLVRPDWREGLICPACFLNSRMRATVHLLLDVVKPDRHCRLYMSEQVTQFARWVRKRYPRSIGSEFLQDGTARGRTNSARVRHEDLTALTFEDASFRFIISQEVFEHVADFRAALKECARVLQPDGKLLFTVPFHRGERHTTLARKRPDGTIEHLVEPPEYHGDPIDPRGCLCYYHFGWELIDDLKAAGFVTAAAYVFASRDLCYSDSGQPLIHFIATT